MKTNLTNLDRGYTIEVDDALWKELDGYQINYVSFVPGTLRVSMRNPDGAPSKDGSWRSYRIATA